MLDPEAGQCQPCASHCLECEHRPHWCTRCENNAGLALKLRRRVDEFAVATCAAVSPGCKTSERPAGEGADLDSEYSCTSCQPGEGLDEAHSIGVGRCAPCHESCSDCVKAGCPFSCLSCPSDAKDGLLMLDSATQTGTCKGDVVLIPRNESREECGDQISGAHFVAIKLGNKPGEDLGICRKFKSEPSLQCAPEDDSEEVPLRRVCTKLALQKVTKKTAQGRSLVVCRLRKDLTCQRESEAADSPDELSSELKGASQVPSERCEQQKSAECVAAISWSEAANTQSAHSIFVEASINTTSQAPGCASLGAEAAMAACQSSLLLF